MIYRINKHVLLEEATDFAVVKAINKVRKQQETESPAEPTATENLLSEIRDLLKK